MLFSRYTWLLPLVAVIDAQDVFSSDLSFGHSGRLTGSSYSDNIPNFDVQGYPNKPVILSNKVILTPPAPGNQRGAIWARNALNQEEWSAEIDFRASGSERGGGNLQIWLADNGGRSIGTSSIYTVAKFEGLAVSFDAIGSGAGMVRGFLNDGSISHRDHHSVESLAFGHCSSWYRNLGRATTVKLQQTKDKFSVMVDTNLCFETDKIRIPTGYFLGISAASANEPDSFEVFRMTVKTGGSTPSEARANGAPVKDGQNQPGEAAKQKPLFLNNDGAVSQQADVPEEAAEKIDQSRQFADLHNRLQANFRHIMTFQRDFSNSVAKQDGQFADVQSKLASIEQQQVRIEEILDSMTKIMRDVRTDSSRLNNELKAAVDTHHRNLADSLHDLLSSIVHKAVPQLGWFVFVLLGSQALLFGAYVLYKRRRANTPKKYL